MCVDVVCPLKSVCVTAVARDVGELVLCVLGDNLVNMIGVMSDQSDIFRGMFTP